MLYSNKNLINLSLTSRFLLKTLFTDHNIILYVYTEQIKFMYSL